MKVLLSINPEHAEKIFSGEKKWEFRKNVFRDYHVRVVVLYVTKPVAKIVGEFDLLRLVVGSPEAVWEGAKEAAGISREFFMDYYSGKTNAVALSIGQVRKYDTPIEPREVIKDFVPPQSFMYLREPDEFAGTGDLFA